MVVSLTGKKRDKEVGEVTLSQNDGNKYCILKSAMPTSTTRSPIPCMCAVTEVSSICLH